MSIDYVNGDVTFPIGDGPKIIVHCCNDVGAFGAGVALAISRKWPKVKEKYLKWHMSRKNFSLGRVQLVLAESSIWVANLIGQSGIGTANGPPIRYDAIQEGLRNVARFASNIGGSIHMPRIGCSLAGGSWSRIEPIVESTLCGKGLHVTVYDHGKFNP